MALTAISSSQSETITFSNGTDNGKSTLVLSVSASGGWVGTLSPQRTHSATINSFATSYKKDLNQAIDNATITGSGIFIFDTTQSNIRVIHTMATSGTLVLGAGVVRD